MFVRRDSNGWSGARALIVRALLTAFVLRALIPVGYMPDFGAVSKGVFKVVVCTAQGLKTMSVDLNGEQTPPSKHGGHDHHPCAFSGMATVAANDDGVVVAVPAYDTAAAIAPQRAVVLPPSRAGPPLGSRAPPAFS